MSIVKAKFKRRKKDGGYAIYHFETDVSQVIGLTEQSENIGAMLAQKVDKEAGKGLSDNNYTDAERAKLRLLAVTEPVDVDDIKKSAHAHANQDLLDAYGQSEANLKAAVDLKHQHQNQGALDSLQRDEKHLYFDDTVLVTPKDVIKYALIL